ncbi:MAG: DUF4093 domain-containing protein [Clostridiales bacterium]|nr:DUF4093 domain-containing protein [Clostridiales bacterium]
MKKKIDQLILVEGRYDKAKLSSIVEASILELEGFRIFKDREKLAYIREAARRRGVIILTDSDAAGFQIRAFLKGAVPEGQLLQAYIPDRYGKERRKAAPGREGKLGVEGMPPEVLLEALERAGASAGQQTFGGLTRTDLYEDGLLGGAGSAQRRRALLERLGLPKRMSTSGLLEAINLLLTPQAYRALVEALNRERSHEGEHEHA